MNPQAIYPNSEVAIEKVNQVLLINNAFIPSQQQQQQLLQQQQLQQQLRQQSTQYQQNQYARSSPVNLTNESMTDTGEDASSNFYRININTSTFETHKKGLSSLSSVTRDRLMDFEEMPSSEYNTASKEAALLSQQNRRGSVIVTTSNAESKISLISSKRSNESSTALPPTSQLSGVENSLKDFFLDQLKMLQAQVSKQENQMYEMSLKCDEMKEENKALKIDLNRISSSTTATNSTTTTIATTPVSHSTGLRISDSHEFQLKKLTLKNSALQTQIIRVKEEYETRLADYENLVEDLNSQLIERDNHAQELQQQLAYADRFIASLQLENSKLKAQQVQSPSPPQYLCISKQTAALQLNQADSLMHPLKDFPFNQTIPHSQNRKKSQPQQQQQNNQTQISKSFDRQNSKEPTIPVSRSTSNVSSKQASICQATTFLQQQSSHESNLTIDQSLQQQIQCPLPPHGTISSLDNDQNNILAATAIIASSAAAAAPGVVSSSASHAISISSSASQPRKIKSQQSSNRSHSPWGDTVRFEGSRAVNLASEFEQRKKSFDFNATLSNKAFNSNNNNNNNNHNNCSNFQHLQNGNNTNGNVAAAVAVIAAANGSSKPSGMGSSLNISKMFMRSSPTPPPLLATKTPQTASQNAIMNQSDSTNMLLKQLLETANQKSKTTTLQLSSTSNSIRGRSKSENRNHKSPSPQCDQFNMIQIHPTTIHSISVAPSPTLEIPINSEILASEHINQLPSQQQQLQSQLPAQSSNQIPLVIRQLIGATTDTSPSIRTSFQQQQQQHPEQFIVQQKSKEIPSNRRKSLQQQQQQQSQQNKPSTAPTMSTTSFEFATIQSELEGTRNPPTSKRASLHSNNPNSQPPNPKKQQVQSQQPHQPRISAASSTSTSQTKRKSETTPKQKQQFTNHVGHSHNQKLSIHPAALPLPIPPNVVPPLPTSKQHYFNMTMTINSSQTTTPKLRSSSLKHPKNSSQGRANSTSAAFQTIPNASLIAPSSTKAAKKSDKTQNATTKPSNNPNNSNIKKKKQLVLDEFNQLDSQVNQSHAAVPTVSPVSASVSGNTVSLTATATTAPSTTAALSANSSFIAPPVSAFIETKKQTTKKASNINNNNKSAIQYNHHQHYLLGQQQHQQEQQLDSAHFTLESQCIQQQQQQLQQQQFEQFNSQEVINNLFESSQQMAHKIITSSFPSSVLPSPSSQSNSARPRAKQSSQHSSQNHNNHHYQKLAPNAGLHSIGQAQSKKSPFPKQKPRSTTSPKTAFYDSLPQSYGDVINYLENHCVADANSNKIRKSLELQHFANLNNAHLRSRSEHAKNPKLNSQNTTPKHQ